MTQELRISKEQATARHALHRVRNERGMRRLFARKPAKVPPKSPIGWLNPTTEQPEPKAKPTDIPLPGVNHHGVFLSVSATPPDGAHFSTATGAHEIANDIAGYARDTADRIARLADDALALHGTYDQASDAVAARWADFPGADYPYNEGFFLNQGPAADTVVMPPVPHQSIVPDAEMDAEMDAPTEVFTSPAEMTIEDAARVVNPQLWNAPNANDTASIPTRSGARTAIMLMVDEHHYVLSTGTLTDCSHVLRMDQSADEELYAQGFRRTTSWSWVEAFLTCGIEPDN